MSDDTPLQAQNHIEFRYDYVDQDDVAIDISTATTITLYLYFPTGTTKTVAGEYVNTTNKNRASAVTGTTTILNADLGEYLQSGTAIVRWHFLAVMPDGNEPRWSPLDFVYMKRNLGAV